MHFVRRDERQYLHKSNWSPTIHQRSHVQAVTWRSWAQHRRESRALKSGLIMLFLKRSKASLASWKGKHLDQYFSCVNIVQPRLLTHSGTLPRETKANCRKRQHPFIWWRHRCLLVGLPYRMLLVQRCDVITENPTCEKLTS